VYELSRLIHSTNQIRYDSIKELGFSTQNISPNPIKS